MERERRTTWRSPGSPPGPAARPSPSPPPPCRLPPCQEDRHRDAAARATSCFPWPPPASSPSPLATPRSRPRPLSLSLLALALSPSRFGAPPRATGGRRRRIHSHRPPLALPMSSGAPSRPHEAPPRRMRRRVPRSHAITAIFIAMVGNRRRSIRRRQDVPEPTDLPCRMLEICPRGNNKLIIIIFPCS